MTNPPPSLMTGCNRCNVLTVFEYAKLEFDESGRPVFICDKCKSKSPVTDCD